MIRPAWGNGTGALPPEMKSQTLRLPDRRKLGILQCGDPHGFPILFFHGFGASRLSLHPDEEIALGLGVRLVAMDRPGIGLSDAQPGRRVVDWPADVLAVADMLEIGRFGVLGCSAGGAYALACAACLPERVAMTGLVSSAAPLDDPALRRQHSRWWASLASISRFAPWLTQLFFDRVARQAQRNPDAFMEQALEETPGPDREIMAQRWFYLTLLKSSLEAYAQGGKGVAEDALALLRPWGFHPGSVSAPVLLWHGEADRSWPVALGRFLAQAIPARQACFYPNEGHYIYLSHWADILLALRAEAD